jgi:glycosyltransferase involved in cell wall biosynthesis
LRALHIALDMRAHGDVYLISRTQIDIPQLCAHFGLPSQGLKSAVIPDFQACDTASLDIFINTAFSSTLHSRARKSAYLVSFPHAEGHVSDMESYDVLLANSRFTQNWCNNYWPSANTQLLYPAAKVSPDGATLHPKERLIVSVGRFFPSGHSKRQLEMVQAFRQLVSLGNSNWRLVLIGGCNLAKGIDDAYLAQVKELARDLPIDILVNAPADIVEQRLQQASIYWHATGVGLNGYAPIEFEHFGMAIVEAMSHSAVPIIHNRGGMPEIVEHGVCGYHFDSLDALISQTQALMRLHDQQPDAFRQLASAAHTRSQAFSLQVHSDTLRQLVTQYLV